MINTLPSKKALLLWIILPAILIIIGAIALLTKPSPTAEQESAQENERIAYTNAEFGFFINYPGRLTIDETDGQPEGKILAIKSENRPLGMSVSITDFGEPDGYPSLERLKKDIPDLKITDVQEISIDVLGKIANQKALKFYSDNPIFGGNSVEAWFFHGGNFYQISASALDEQFFNDLIRGWRFE